MQSFAVPKHRRPRFELRFRLLDLNNVPLVSGTSHVKWHLAGSHHAEHSGKTPRCGIKDHKVVYDYGKTIELHLVIGKDSVLLESFMQFEVIQEYQTSGRTERITLGLVKLNLAEYVDPGASDEADNGAVTRRYLMQESKINSTLKIEIAMRHLEGDRNYTAPTLKTAAVFGGITGIISTDAAEAVDEGNTIPSLSTKSREHGELQDMYRRTLAASWAAGPGEPKADECIEDIFSGGDGWGGRAHQSPGSSSANTPMHSKVNLGVYNENEDESKSRTGSTSNIASVFSSGRRKPKWSTSKDGPSRHGSPAPGFHNHGHGHHGHHDLHERPSSGGLNRVGVAGRTSLEQSMRKIGHRGHGNRRAREIDEFENPFKEDLRSWHIKTKA